MELITNTITDIQFADKIEQARQKGMNILLPGNFNVQNGNVQVQETIPGFIYKVAGDLFILDYDEFNAQVSFLNEKLANLDIANILCTVTLSFFSKNVFTRWAGLNESNIAFAESTLYDTEQWAKQIEQQRADTWIVSEAELMLLLSTGDALPEFLQTMVIVNPVNEDRWINELLAKRTGLNILFLIEFDVLPGFSFYKEIRSTISGSKVPKQYQCTRKECWKVSKNGKTVSSLMKGFLNVRLQKAKNDAGNNIERELTIPARMQSGGFEIFIPESNLLTMDGYMPDANELRTHILNLSDATDAVVLSKSNGLFPFTIAYNSDERINHNILPAAVKMVAGLYKAPNRQLLYGGSNDQPDDSSLDILSAYYAVKGKKIRLQSYTEFSYDRLNFPQLPSKANTETADTKPDLPLALVEAPLPAFPVDLSFTLTGHLKKVAAGDGTITFIREDRTEDVVSYNKLLSDAEKIASGLLKLDIPAQTPVLLQLENQASWITMYWAVLLDRFISAPLAVPKVFSEENDTVQKLKNILELLDNPVVVCERKNYGWYQQQFKNWGYTEITLLVWEDMEFVPAITLPDVQPDDVALYMFTSGSTGLPKCIRQTHHALVFRNYSVGLHCSLRSNDVFLNWMPLDHIGGIQMAHNNAIVNGGSQVSIPIDLIISDPVYWIDLIDKYRASYTWSPNFAFNQLSQETEKLKSGNWDLSCMRHWLTGGESVSASVTRQVIELLIPHGLNEKAIFPAYGMSETCSGITHALDFDSVRTGLNHIVQSSMSGVLSYKEDTGDDTVCLVEVGPPVPGISLRITDRTNNILTENQIGLLQVTGPTITKGYLKNEEANQQLLTDGWFNTGDLGFIKNGVLTITGREKDLIIINGLNYQNYELERYLEELPEIGSNGAITASSFDPVKGREILYVFFKSENRNYKNIATKIRNTLVRAAGVSPDVIVSLRDTDFLVTTSGKKRRPVVLEQYLEQRISPLYDSSVAKNEGYDHTLFFKEAWLETPIQPSENDNNENWLITDCISLASSGYFSRVFTHTEWAAFINSSTENTLQYVNISYDATGDNNIFNTNEWISRVNILKQLFKNDPPAKFQYITKGLINHNSSNTSGYIPGLLSSIAEELEHTQVRWIDTDTIETEVLLKQARAELQDAAKFVAISYQNGKRYQQAVAPLPQPIPVSDDVPINENGFYLITGGFGGIGSFLLRKLVDKYNIKALVIGRTDLNTDTVHGSIFDFENRVNDRKAILNSLPEKNIIYRCCNIADAAVLQTIISETEKEYGQIDGYFHLAGVARLTYHWEHINEHLFTEEKPEVFEWMLQSKVQGTLNLEHVFGERKDFLRVVFGSVNAYFGANSFSTYAAVNSFIRFFTEEQNRKGKNFHTIHWSQWKGLGMSEGNEMDALSINRGYSVIEPEEGWKALLNVLRLEPGNYISGLQPQNKYIQDTTVFPSYKQTLIALKDPDIADRELLPLERSVGSALSSWQIISAKNNDLWTRTSWSEDYLSDLAEETDEETVLPTQTEAVLTDIWKELLGLEKIRLTDNFFQLGGHSIKATRMLARVKDRFHVQLSFSVLFKYATLSDLAEYIEELKGNDVDVSIPAAQRSDYYPLSPSQYRLWMVHKMEGGGHAYLVPGIYDIEGRLEIERFKQAIDALVEKHEILRTVFIEKGNMPYQQIEEDVKDSFTFHAKPGNIDEEIKKIISEGLNLDGGILFHCHLFAAGTDKYRLLVLLHHINADGVTLAILRKDLTALYMQYVSGHEVTIAVPSVQYKDFSVWYDSYLASPESAQLRAYWMDKLSGQLPVLDMPSDYPRKLKQSFKGASIDLKLDDALTSKLEKIASDNRMSVFAVLISLVKTVLWRHSGQNDVIVGTSTDLRINGQLENQIGQYVNVLPLRDHLDNELSFDKLLSNINSTLVDALENKLYPFEKLVTELQLDRDTSRSPLFSTLLVMHNFETNTDTLTDTIWTPVHHDNDTSKFDYVFAFRKEADGMLINLRYCTDLFYESRALHLLEDINALATAVCKDTTQSIGNYSLATDISLKTKVVAPFEILHFKDIITLFSEHAANDPAATAIVYDDKQLSYGELYRSAKPYAALCNKIQGNRIVVIKTPGTDWIASLLGIWMANKCYIPVDASFPMQVIMGQLQEIKPAAVFTTDSLKADVQLWLENSGLADVNIYTEGIENNNAAEAVNNGDEEAYIVFTSGSTGKPKGIIGNRRSLSQFIAWETEALGITNTGTTVSQLTQPTFDASLRDIFLALATGNTLAIPSKDKRKDLTALTIWLSDSKVNIVHAVPSLMRGILANKPANKTFDIKHVLCAGEQLYKNDITNIHEVFGKDVNVINLYGATESTLVKTYWQYGQPWHFDALPAGKGIDNCDVLILNEYSQLCSPGEKGEVYIRTPYLSNGYLDTSLNKKAFVQNPLQNAFRDIVYRTGDVGRYTMEGWLQLAGRKDEQVKINGVRIELKEIELAALRISGISQSVVKAWQQEEVISIALYYTSEQHTESSVQDELKKILPVYAQPAFIVKLDAIPMNANGKTDKSKLPDPRTLANEDIVATDITIHPALLAAWAQVLKQDVAEANNGKNFFQSGGNSLLAMILLAKVQQAFGVRIPIEVFFRDPSLALLQSYVPVEIIHSDEGIRALPPADAYALSHAQQRMWILNEMETDNITYNVKRAFALKGDVGIDALRETVAALVRRHEVLRTSFHYRDGKVIQSVHKEFDIADCFSYEDISAKNNAREFAREKVDAIFSKPFRLDSYPLLKVALIKTATDEYIFCLVKHHIISDGWSMEVISKELIEGYNAIVQGGKYQPAALPFNYKDFAAWQNEYLQQKAVEEDEAYWLSKFNHIAEPIELPTDRPRFAVKTYNGDLYKFSIDKQLSERLRQFSEEQHATVFMVMLSAIKLLFYRYTGSQDITIGTPSAGRRIPGLENQLGFYVNTLALRTAFDPGDSFAVLLDKIRQTTLDALEHQDYPFDRLIEKLDLEKRMDHSPLFDVVVQFMNTSVTKDKAASFNNINVQPFETTWHTSQFDQNFFFTETPDGIQGVIEYNTDLFDRETIVREITHITNLLIALVADPSLTVNKVQFLTEAETAAHSRLQDTQAVYPHHSMYRQFELATENRQNQNAIISTGGNLTYAALKDNADKLAALLGTTTQGKQVKVALLMDEGADAVTAMLAALKAGCCYVPVAVTFPYERMRYMLSDSEATILIFSKNYLKQAGKLYWECKALEYTICIDSDNVFAEREPLADIMSEELWNFIGQSATDDITGGAWFSSYTGLPISRLEMNEYADNSFTKLKPYLNKNTRVLEIGCASAITMSLVGPQVQHYTGTDLSSNIIEIADKNLHSKGVSNYDLVHAAAHEVAAKISGQYDVVILNSVVQCFSGYNYLRQVIESVLPYLSDDAVIFFGDIQDLDQKYALEQSLRDYAAANDSSRVKLDWSQELFVPKAFFNDLKNHFPEVVAVTHSEKIGTVKNELTEFRYDTIVHIRKEHTTHDICKTWYDHSDISASTALERDAVTDLGTPAYIIYTSGSTGNPKGCIITHRNLMRLFFNDHMPFDFSDRDVWIQSHGYHFDFSVWEIYGALLYGGTVVIPNREEIRDISRYYNMLKQHKVTVLNQTPRAFYNFSQHVLQNNDPHDVSSHLRHVIFGGEKLQPARLKEWMEQYSSISMINMYGITETTVHVSFHKITMDEVMAMPYYSVIGHPIPETTIALKDGDGNDVPFNVPAEMVVGGTGVAPGYFNRPELTAEKFVPDTNQHGHKAYRSGDYGKLLASGDVIYINRRDAQVKIRGYRIETGEIENALLQHPEVNHAAVIVRTDNAGDNNLVAYYTGTVTDKDILRKFLSVKLPSYMVPAAFIQLDAMPMTINGKLDVKKLPDPNALGVAFEAIDEQDLSHSEQVVWKAFCEVLGTENIGLNDNFFEHGGHSLKAMNLMSLLHSRIRVGVPLVYLYKFPTVKEIAHYIDCARYMNIQYKEHPYLQLGNPEGKRTMILFPPALGSALAYSHLAELLEDTRMFSFNYVDNNDTMANYVRLLNELQPEGDLYIAGHSAGGFMAFHVAKAMEKAGRKVGGVIILDAFRQGKEGKQHTLETIAEGVDLYLDHKFNEYKDHFIDMDFFKEVCYNQVKQYYDFLFHAEQEGDIFIQAPIHFMIAENNYERQENWTGATAAGVKVYYASGVHGRMVDEPWVQPNAVIIKDIIKQQNLTV